MREPVSVLALVSQLEDRKADWVDYIFTLGQKCVQVNVNKRWLIETGNDAIAEQILGLGITDWYKVLSTFYFCDESDAALFKLMAEVR